MSSSTSAATFQVGSSLVPQEQPTLSGNSRKGKNRIIRDLSHYLESTFVVFEVGDRVFRTPTHRFIQESPSFTEAYGLRLYTELSDKTNALGSARQRLSDDHVIKLNDTRPDDFKCLLKVLYPLNLSMRISLTTEEWISVLCIATERGFFRIRQMAISELERLKSLSSIQKVCLGWEMGFTSWVIDGLVELVLRSATIDDDEAFDLDRNKFTTAYAIYRLRNWRIKHGMVYASSVKAKVEARFRNELEAIRAKELGYRFVDADSKRREESAIKEEAERQAQAALEAERREEEARKREEEERKKKEEKALEEERLRVEMKIREELERREQEEREQERQEEEREKRRIEEEEAQALARRREARAQHFQKQISSFKASLIVLKPFRNRGN
ncbi:hypothetical protein D9613_001028 [Agrocybe pediades]|uniref:BTB domain-containing protein n=1 Tax=Agrocybe pediades TaxID=84607 RepID=A0A8H4R135_9AGAR|nr:hypothetical protein D9613_001028 [Agrocybe pediades]